MATRWRGGGEIRRPPLVSKGCRTLCCGREQKWSGLWSRPWTDPSPSHHICLLHSSRFNARVRLALVMCGARYGSARPGSLRLGWSVRVGEGGSLGSEVAAVCRTSHRRFIRQPVIIGRDIGLFWTSLSLGPPATRRLQRFAR